MDPQAPSATIKLGDSITIAFDLERIEAIESALGIGCYEIVDKLILASGCKITEEGKVEDDGKVMPAFKVGFACNFIAACAGMPAEQVKKTCRLGALKQVFFTLAGAYMKAMNQFAGDEEGGAEGNAAASTGPGSEPGPASNSA